MLEETVKKLSDTLHGKGTLTFAANTPFSLIASSGSSKVVHIYNLKNAQLLEQLIPKSSTPVSFLAWDKTGKLLVIIQKDSPIIMVWNKTSKKATHIDLKLKELIFAKFSDDSKEIAVGTSRGTLLIYNLISDTKYTSTHNGVAAAGKKIPINCGDWSNDKFVYASEDGMISACNKSGKLLASAKLEGCVCDVKVANNMVAANLGGEKILLYNFSEKRSMKFEKIYGNVVWFQWLKDRSIIVGFKKGYIVVASTNTSDSNAGGRFCMRFLNDGEELIDMSYSDTHQKLAICGSQNTLKIIDLHTWSESVTKCRAIDKVEWVGGVLCASTAWGFCYFYREAVPNEVTKIVGLLRNLFAGWDSQVTAGVFFALVGVVWGVVGLSDRLLTTI